MNITSITLLSSILVALITSVLGPILLVWVRSKFDNTKNSKH